MNVPADMTDMELKKFINNGEQFLFEPGDLYKELIEAGYSKEKIDLLIAEKGKKGSTLFKTNAIFLSIVMICLGVLIVTGYFGQSLISVLSGALFFIVAWLMIKMAVK